MSERIVKMVSAPVESVHGVYKPSPVVDAKSGLHAALHMVMKHTADMFVTIVDVLSEKYSLDKEEMFGVILEHPKYKDMYVNPVLLDLGYISAEEPDAKAEEPKPQPESKPEEPVEKPRRKMSDEAKAAAAAKRAATIAAKKSATTKPEPQPEPQPEPTEAKPEPTEAKPEPTEPEPTETNPEITATAAPKKRVFKIKAKAPTT